jgi:hypothetical protein
VSAITDPNSEMRLSQDRAMNDTDGPYVAKAFYEKLFAHNTIDADSIAYALDYAIRELRKSGVPLERWATFVHIGA